MLATQQDSTVLCCSLELSLAKWVLTFDTGFRRGTQPKRRVIAAGDFEALGRQIAWARKHYRLEDQVPVVTCYEAGRDGFWIDRALAKLGIRNFVIDPASIEQSRRQKNAKTDRLDGRKLTKLLVRHVQGDDADGDASMRIVVVPGVADEDERQPHRELERLKNECNRHTSRIQGLLFKHGIRRAIPEIRSGVEDIRMPDGSPLPAGLACDIGRQWQRLKLVDTHIREVQQARLQLVRMSDSPKIEQVRRLMMLRGIGIESAWMYVMEFFGWRRFNNRRELAALAGLAPVPFSSGSSVRDQGVSKAGNRRVRAMAVEIAWLWLQYQPESELSKWFHKRVGDGGGRVKRIAIVAVARKLLIALWRYLEHGVVPPGARLSTI